MNIKNKDDKNKYVDKKVFVSLFNPYYLFKHKNNNMYVWK